MSTATAGPTTNRIAALTPTVSMIETNCATRLALGKKKALTRAAEMKQHALLVSIRKKRLGAVFAALPTKKVT
jgi:hypothetical protein